MRRFAFLLGIALAIPFLAGCGGESASESLPPDSAEGEVVAPADSFPGDRAFVQDLGAHFDDPSALEAQFPILADGPLIILADDTTRHVVVYAVGPRREAVLVAVNRSGEAHSIRVELPVNLRRTYGVAHASTREGYRLQQDATALLLELPERFGMILTAPDAAATDGGGRRRRRPVR